MKTGMILYENRTLPAQGDHDRRILIGRIPSLVLKAVFDTTSQCFGKPP